MLGKLTVLLGLLALTVGVAVAQTPSGARARPVVAKARPVAAPASPDEAMTPAVTPTTTHHVFEIMREGNKIGSETVDIEKLGDTTTAKLKTHISVIVMFIEAYRFDHSATEVWTGGKFASYKATTNANGKRHAVTAVAKNDKVALNIDGEHSELDGDIVPVSLWSKSFLDRTSLLDPDTGKQLSVKVSDLGDESIEQNGTKIQAHHYKISGDIDRDVWFDGDTLVRIKLLGSDHSTIISELTPENKSE